MPGSDDGIIASVVVRGGDCAKATADKAEHITIAEKTRRKPINESSRRSPKRRVCIRRGPREGQSRRAAKASRATPENDDCQAADEGATPSGWEGGATWGVGLPFLRSSSRCITT